MSEYLKPRLSLAEFARSITTFEMADLLGSKTIYEQMGIDLATKFGTSPDRVHFVGTHEEGNALMGEFIVRCDRCGHVQKEPVCEHCQAAIKPTVKIEQWQGFEVHSTVRHKGKKIWIDEVVYEPK